MNSLLKIKQHCRWALAAALGLWSSAGAAGLDLQFIGGTNPSTGAACSLTLDSRCRFNNVVVGANGTSYQRDIIVTVTKLTNATLTTAFDNASPTLQGTQTPRATASQFFAPTVQPPQNVANTIGWAEFTFDVVPSGGAVPTVGGGTAALPGTFWVSSFDTDGDSSALREFVEYLSPNATGLSPNTTLTASTAVNGGTQFQGNVAGQTSISTDDPYKSTALYDSPRTFRLVYGARIGGTGSSTGGRLTAFDFFRPDGVITRSIVEGYKSVQLTTDADASGSVSPGDTVTYSVVYANTGNAAASNFQITDTLPSGLALTATGAQNVYVNGTLTSSARNTGYTGTSANNALLAAGQTLVADGTIRVDIPARVTQATAGSLSNQASASTTSSGTLVAQTEAVDSASTFPPTVTGAAGWRAIPSASVAQTALTGAQDPTVLNVVLPPPVRLSITKTDNGATFYTGSTATYTVTVTNTAAGSTSSGALNLSDLLPSGLSYSDVTANVAGTFGSKPAAGATGRVNWTFTPSSPLSPGQSVTFTVKVNVSNTLANGTTLTNYASVGGGGDPDAQPTPGATCTGEQCASDTTTVNRVTQLTLRKEFPQGANSTANRVTIRIRNGAAILGSMTTASSTTPPAVSTSTIDVAPGTTYTLDEVAADAGTYLSTYVSRYTCTNATTGSTTVMPTNATGTSFTLTPQAGDVITCTFSNYKTPPQPPLECKNTMYGLVGDNTNGYTQVQTISPSSGASGGTTIWTVPVRSASLGISPDGARLFAAAYNSATLYYRDITLGISGSATLPGYTSSSGNLLRMAIASDGTGYLSSGTQYWTFTTVDTPVVSGPYTLTSSDSTVDTTGNGDLITASNGDVYLIKSPTTASNYIDVFKISGTSGTTAQYYGRVTDSDLNQAFGGAAALSTGLYVSSTSGRLSNVNLATYSASTVTSSAAITADLASCYYPNLAPNITATKSVSKVAGSAGTSVLPGDTLEYTIVTRNSGTLSTSTATLQDTVPAGTTYVAGSTTMNLGAVADRSGVTGNDLMPFSVARAISSPGAGGGVVEVDSTTNTVTSSPTDADDNEVVVKFRVTVNAGTTEVRNRATVVHVDGTALTNETVTSAGQPALTIVKSVDTSYVKVTVPDPANSTALTISPQRVVYTITVTSTGSVPANNVKVTDTLPAGLRFISATLARSTGTGAGGVTTYGTASPVSSTTASPDLTFDVGTLPVTEPGRSVQIRIVAEPTVAANTNQTAYLNTAKVSATSVAEDSSAQVRTDVVYTRLFKQVHNLGSAPAAEVPQQTPTWGGSGHGLPDDVLEYCIDFYNYGSVALNNYIVKDAVPTNTTYVPDSATVKTGTMTTTPVQPFPGVVVGEANGVVTATISSLAPQTSGSLCFRTRIR